MRLDTDVARVAAVLLPVGQWHTVEDASFEIGSYEYVGDSERQDQDLVPAAGARWSEKDRDGSPRTVFCPITSIQAVAYKPERRPHYAARRVRS